VETGVGPGHYCRMLIRGKDAQETRFRRHLWWQANRDWLAVVTSISAIVAAFALIARVLG
jgi:hypothetical protein